MKKVNIKGTIISSDEAWIYDWFGIENTNPKSVTSELDRAGGEDIEVDINSGGGSVFAGSEIYTALKSYSGKVTVRIVGLAASAASVIAMAGNKVVISPTAQMMIHNVSSGTSGDYRDMEHSAEVLKNANQTIANAYMIKTGMEQADLLAMMDNETWLTPQQAIEKGFADEIMFSEQSKMVASYGSSMILPEEVINKIRNTVKSPQSQQAEADFLMQKCRLNLLKLKGVTND